MEERFLCIEVKRGDRSALKLLQTGIFTRCTCMLPNRSPTAMGWQKNWYPIAS